MKVQYVSEYISLAQEGLVKKLECPVDQGPLVSNQDIDDNIYLYCLYCDYEKTVGIEFYNQIKKAVDNVRKLRLQ